MLVRPHCLIWVWSGCCGAREVDSGRGALYVVVRATGGLCRRAFSGLCRRAFSEFDFGHLIDPSRVPGMTASHSFYRQNRTATRAEALKRGHRIVRTGGVKATLPTDKQAERQLIAANQRHKHTSRPMTNRDATAHDDVCSGLAEGSPPVFVSLSKSSARSSASASLGANCAS